MINASQINASQINGEESSAFYGSLSLPLTLRVASTGSLSLPLILKTTATGSLSLPLTLVVTDLASYSSPQAKWGVRLLLDGVDISARLSGQIRIDSEEGAARLARFGYFPSGVISPTMMVGKRVEIDYFHRVADVAQPSVRRFTGFVDVPELEVTTGMVSISATDNRQNQLSAATREQIDTLTPGASWSKWVFDDGLQGLEYLDARLSTLAASLDKDAQGAFRLTPWAAKSSPDFIYGMGQHFYATPTLQIARRDRLVNTVYIEFDYRFPRLRARQIGYRWDYRMQRHDYAPSFGVMAPAFPSRSMIKSAALDTGWELAGYEDNVKSGGGYKFADLIAETRSPVELFYLRLKKRWGQRVTEKYRLKVVASNSVANVGEMAGRETSSAEVQFDIGAWEKDPAAPPVLNIADYGDTHQDIVAQADDGRAAADLAMQTLVARAVTRIKASHRANRVTFKMPFDPRLDLNHTVQIAAQHLTAKGKTGQIVETLDINSGEAAMDVTLFLSGVAATGIPSDPVADPPAAPPAPSPLAPGGWKLLWTNIGIPPDYDLEGYTPPLVNVTGIDPQFKIDTPAIDDAERQPVDTGLINQTYSLVVPVDTLTWS